MDHFLCKFPSLTKLLLSVCVSWVCVWIGARKYICVCVSVSARVFSAFQPLLLCMTSLFSFFFGRRHTMATYSSFCSPSLSLCYTPLFCECAFAFQPPEISYLFIVYACHLQLFFSRLEAAFSFFLLSNMFVRMIAIKFCARVCTEFTKKRMFYDFSAVFHPMCILWYHSSYFRTASLSKRANTRTQSLTISIRNIAQTHLCTFNAALFAMEQMQTHFWHGTFNNVQYCLLLFSLLGKNFYSCYFGACFLSVRHLKNN